MTLPIRTLESKIDCKRFVQVQAEAEPSQPLAKNTLDAHTVKKIIKHQNEVSSPEESNLRALAEPDVNVSAHPAPIIQPPAPDPSANARTGRDRVQPRDPASASHGVCASEVS